MMARVRKQERLEEAIGEARRSGMLPGDTKLRDNLGTPDEVVFIEHESAPFPFPGNSIVFVVEDEMMKEWRQRAHRKKLPYKVGNLMYHTSLRKVFLNPDGSFTMNVDVENVYIIDKTTNVSIVRKKSVKL